MSDFFIIVMCVIAFIVLVGGWLKEKQHNSPENVAKRKKARQEHEERKEIARKAIEEKRKAAPPLVWKLIDSVATFVAEMMPEKELKGSIATISFKAMEGLFIAPNGMAMAWIIMNAYGITSMREKKRDNDHLPRWINNHAFKIIFRWKEEKETLILVHYRGYHYQRYNFFAFDMGQQGCHVSSFVKTLVDKKREEHIKKSFGELQMESNGGKPGWVYVLTNPDYPGTYKIGKTTKSVAERLKGLNSSTSLRYPFHLATALRTNDAKAAEDYIHSVLEKYRNRKGREFFTLPAEKLEEILSKLAGKTIRLDKPMV